MINQEKDVDIPVPQKIFLKIIPFNLISNSHSQIPFFNLPSSIVNRQLFIPSLNKRIDLDFRDGFIRLKRLFIYTCISFQILEYK